MAKYEDNAKKRIKSNVEKYADIIRRAEQEGFNEANTGFIVRDMLGEVFGYDKFFDVTSEYQIKGHFSDCGVKIDGELRFLIEIKAIGTVLGKKRDLFQLIGYCANQGLEWGVLTNARVWRCYRLELGSKESKLVFQVDFLDENQSFDKKIKNLFWLTKEGIMYCGALPKTHGARRTNAEKRRAVELLLRDKEWARCSLSEISRMTGGVSGAVIKSVQEALEREAQVESREGEPVPEPVVGTKDRKKVTVTRGGTTYEMDVSGMGRQKKSEEPAAKS